MKIKHPDHAPGRLLQGFECKLDDCRFEATYIGLFMGSF